VNGVLSTSESIASSAVKTAIDVNAKAIIVCSESGTTATQVAKFRPGRPIFVLTLSERVARQCSGLLRSASAFVVPNFDDMDNQIINLVAKTVKDGLCKPGDAIVAVTGTIHQKGATNLMRVQYA
jgi:pyruvate kinase